MTSPLTQNVQNCCLFQFPYHFDRTGVRVMNICPGVTDTALFVRPHGACCGKSGETKLKGTLINFLRKSEYLSSRSGLCYIVPTQAPFLDTMAVNFYNFVRNQKMTSDFFVLGYLRTIFQLYRIGRMSGNCVKKRVQ
jgi:hypothetical protein